MLSGALEAATDGTSAASNWSSPSTSSSGYCSFAILVASTTFVTRSCFALPFVEWDSIATFAFFPVSCSKDSAEDAAIAANSSGFGSWFKPQSPNTNTPSSPYSQFGTIIKKNADTNLQPGFVLMICRHGRSVLAVEWHAPDTIPSASPALIIKHP